MKIAVAGIGYVGLSNAILLAQHNEVVAYDIMPARVDAVNARMSPLIDAEIEDYLANKTLNLRATSDSADAFRDADYVIVSTPTNYDPVSNFFNTSSIDAVIETVIKINPNAVIIIKSTIPVGFTSEARRRHGTDLFTGIPARRPGPL